MITRTNAAVRALACAAALFLLSACESEPKAHLVSVVLADKDGHAICKDVDKIIEMLGFVVVDCLNPSDYMEANPEKGKCAIFKPFKNQKVYKDEADFEYYRVQKGDYIGIEKK